MFEGAVEVTVACAEPAAARTVICSPSLRDEASRTIAPAESCTME